MYQDIAVLTRDPFEVLGKGYECNKQVIQVTTYTNIFYAKYQKSTIENLDVSEEVCRKMVETKQCGETIAAGQYECIHHGFQCECVTCYCFYECSCECLCLGECFCDCRCYCGCVCEPPLCD